MPRAAGRGWGRPPDRPRCRALARAWAPTLHALGHQDRLLIVLWLAGGARSVRELQDVTGLAQSVVSYHLAQLRVAGLVAAHPEGRSNKYRLQNPELDEVATILGTLAPGTTEPGTTQP
jgi:DNA-binding transcriptional ArsR family regulator